MSMEPPFGAHMQITLTDQCIRKLQEANNASAREASWMQRIMNLLTLCYLIVTVVACCIGYLSYRGSNEQQKVFENQVQLIERLESRLKEQAEVTQQQIGIHRELTHILKDYEMENKVLDFQSNLLYAERAFQRCPMCRPTYSVSDDLESAAAIEPTIASFLHTSHYLRMAALGIPIWEFGKTDELCQRAYEKAKTPLDKHVALLMRGHINSIYFGADTKSSFDEARRHFNAACLVLTNERPNINHQFFLGKAYELWAAHEKYQRHDEDANQRKQQAKAAWAKLPNYKELERGLDDQLENASKGIPPAVPFDFMNELPVIPAAAPIPIMERKDAASVPRSDVPPKEPTPAKAKE